VLTDKSLKKYFNRCMIAASLISTFFILFNNATILTKVWT